MEYVIIVGAVMVLAFIFWSRRKPSAPSQNPAPYKVEKPESTAPVVLAAKTEPVKAKKPAAKKAKPAVAKTKEVKLKRSK